MARLVAIRRVRPDLLLCRWDDGLEVFLPVAVLRDQCPCALCRGEQVFDQVLLPVRVLAPGMYELEKLEPVGNYGLRAVWKDGHNTGIYPWDLLHQLCRDYGIKEEPQQAEGRDEPGAGTDTAGAAG